ncbi:hypothetical protein SBI_01193 [Streptomyces bingchenggensis BCW-1]|uniref:Uncharacterized protein n=1 Tax=Streptomyces bingchenggensis (strain BCW-1) TaxID=749414 RepID=D7C9Y6_STRBB|nr:hypothetical protein SBI_01193 [Streptomyces bingchenggensis BCW-1]
MTATDRTTSGLDCGYVLHPHSNEVINLYDEDIGPLVG